jgi:hypothetical protein
LYWIEAHKKNDTPTHVTDSELTAIRLPFNALEITDEPCTLCTDKIDSSSDGGGGGTKSSNSFKFSNLNSEEHDELMNSASHKIKGRECGLVVGERSSTIFALDAETGGVRWIKDTHTGRHANFDVNLHAESGEEVLEDEPMLLQRDKYTVRFIHIYIRHITHTFFKTY